jgi:hypothetical protein
MKITIDNYEAWLLDHLEGRLNETQTALLTRFLAEHPELDAASDNHLPVLEPCHTSCEKGFAYLKQPADAVVSVAGFDASNYDEAFAAYHEGDLDQNGKVNLHRFVALNPVLSSEFNLYEQLKLIPEYIPFPHKASLRRQRTIPLFVRWTVPAAAAAAVALLLLSTPSGHQLQVENPQELAATKPQPLINQPGDPDSKPAAHASNVVFPQESSVAMAHQETARLPHREPMLVVTSLKPLEASSVSAPIAHREIEEGSRFYTCLYADIRLRDQLRFQQEVEEQGAQTIYGDAVAQARKNRFDLWTIARLGVKGFNFLTNSDIEFNKSCDEEGKVTDFAIGGESVRVAHSSK